MAAPWLVALLVSAVLNVAAYILMPKPKAPKPGAVQEAQNPTAEAGRPVPVIFGSVTVKSPNVLWFGDKQAKQYQIKV